MITSKKKINFYHCDPAGILFYARLFEICHSVYEEIINSFELVENFWQNDDYVVPIVKCEAGFFKPVKPGEEVTVELFVSQLRKTSFELSYEIKNENNVSVASAKTVHVFVDRKIWKGKEIINSLRNGLNNHLKK
ncbi:MAG: acyl-CoA thioesterase [Ignavibacteriaceae bacterium]|jgi:YbgC/YbaW family acyl-CoA thioester hydrolase